MDASTISYNLKSIGQIVNSIENIKDMPILGVKSKIEIDAELIDGLVGLNDYSHIIILAFMHKIPKSVKNQLITFPSGNNKLPEQGIFALRGKRTNPISFNVCKINKIVNGLIEVDKIDLVSGTPVLDLKPYLPFYDSYENATIPKWAY